MLLEALSRYQRTYGRFLRSVPDEKYDDFLFRSGP
jgi:hypothetical protein